METGKKKNTKKVAELIIQDKSNSTQSKSNDITLYDAAEICLNDKLFESTGEKLRMLVDVRLDILLNDPMRLVMVS